MYTMNKQTERSIAILIVMTSICLWIIAIYVYVKG